ncbi:MAG: hypothetical protein N2170_07830, partial [Bacteroidia bacterium]|nr:hypothetical protein [Bacteroidia bacterium]
MSDGSSVSSGWAAVLQCVSSPLPQRYALSGGSLSLPIDCSQGFVFTDDGGTEGPYSPLVDDTVTFQPPVGSYAVVAFPYQLHLAAGDTLWVWESTISPT